jgi:cell division protein FtsZ
VFEDAKPMEEANPGWSVKVMGLGRTGIQAIRHMTRSQHPGVEFFVDARDAAALSAPLGASVVELPWAPARFGAADAPIEVAGAAADALRGAFAGADLVLLVADVGHEGDDGVVDRRIVHVADVARGMGITTIALVTTWQDEDSRAHQREVASTLVELHKTSSTLLELALAKIQLDLGPHASLDDARVLTNHRLVNSADAFVAVVKASSHVNVDFEDVRSVFGSPGRAWIGEGFAMGMGRSTQAGQRVLDTAAREGIDLATAGGLLVMVTADQNSLKLGEPFAAKYPFSEVARDAHVLYGTAYSTGLGRGLRVTVIATQL